MKTLTVVDDCSKEAVRIAADTSMPSLYVIRTDNGPEFAGRGHRNEHARDDQVRGERGLPKGRRSARSSRPT